jgi:hypothetical protein
VNAFARRVEEVAACELADPARVFGATPQDVRREKDVDFQFASQRFICHVESYLHEHHGTVRIRQQMLNDTISAIRVRIGEPVKRAIAFRIVHLV